MTRSNLYLEIFSSFMILYIILYPTSPVLIYLVGIDSEVILITFLSALTVITIIKGQKKKIRKFTSIKITIFVILVLTLMLNLSTVDFNKLARESVSLIVVMYYLHTLDDVDLKNQSKLITLQIIIFLSISLIFYMLFRYDGLPTGTIVEPYAGLDNPIQSRADSHEYLYYFPFGLSVIPARLGSDEFVRFPFIFTEPTYFWALGFAPVILTLTLTKMDFFTKLCISSILIIYGCLNLSIAYILLYLLVFTCCLVLRSKSVLKKSVSIVLLFIFILTTHRFVYDLFGILFVSKVQQITLLVDNFIFNFRLTGISDGPSLDYGFLTIVNNYGTLPLLLMGIILIYFITRIRSFLDTVGLIGTVAMITTVIYWLKMPTIFYFVPLLYLEFSDRDMMGKSR